MQKKLDAHIVEDKGLEGQDLLDKKILGLFTELGELANEQRSWKYWSEDQEPRTKIVCIACHGVGEVNEPIGGHYMDCPHCDGSGLEETTNPLLEEYVDDLHFVFSLGNDLGYSDAEYWGTIEEKTIEVQFIECQGAIFHLYLHRKVTGEVPRDIYELLLARFISLGEMLGFTWDQIEQAYYSKNKINHERQEAGY